MILKDIKREIRQRVGDSEAQLVTDGDLETWVNLAVRHIWKSWPWPFTKKQDNSITTVSGTATITLPTDLQRVVKVVDKTNEFPLRPQQERLLQEWYSTTTTGEPTYYTDGGLSQAAQTAAPKRQLRLYPTPNGAYTLRITYLALPTSISAEDHFTPLPEDFDEAVISWCLVRFYRKIEDLQQAAEHNQEFNTELGRLFEVYGTWQHEEYPSIPWAESVFNEVAGE